MRTRIAFTTLIIGALAVSGCAKLLPGYQKQGQDLFKEARQSERAPEEFHDELPRKSCGQVTLVQDEQIPADAVDCMDSAIGRLDAELAVISLTTEGDPILDFYRTSAGNPGVEVFTDDEFDRYGSKEWTPQDCPSTTTLTSLQDCHEFWFILTRFVHCAHSADYSLADSESYCGKLRNVCHRHRKIHRTGKTSRNRFTIKGNSR